MGNELIRRVTVNALIAVVTALLTLAALEAVVRLGGETDADGQFTFMGHALEEPYAPMAGRELKRRKLEEYVEKQRRLLEEYLEKPDQAIHIYDEWLGWTFRPNATMDTWKGKPFTTNSAGMRSQREYSQTPPPDTVRIALFGDSFTAGNGVGDDETWGHYLELELNQAGIRTEVLNFGVSGYGMDQAFLRWQKAGRGYAPDMVVFGFQPENLNRNVNIFSVLYFRHLPFSKPRFVLTAAGGGGGLELPYHPVMPLEQTAYALESLGSHHLAEHEYYYTAPRWWSFSRLAAFLHVALTPRDRRDYGLGKAIVDAFANDVKAREAEFFVLYLPKRGDLLRLHEGAPHPYQFLLDHFDEAYHYISFEDQLDRSYLNFAYYPDGSHYAPEITSIAAQTVADEIQSCIESGTCELPRFEDRNVIFTSASSGDSA